MTLDHDGSVRIRIDKLVLEGVRAGDRYRAAEAIERELARLLRERTPATLTHAISRSVLDAGQIDATPDATPETIGASVARAIYAGFDTSGKSDGRSRRRGTPR